jgi:hypothetical protein
MGAAAVESFLNEPQADRIVEDVGVEEILDLHLEERFKARSQRPPEACLVVTQKPPPVKPAEEGLKGRRRQVRQRAGNLGNRCGTSSAVDGDEEPPLGGRQQTGLKQ